MESAILCLTEGAVRSLLFKLCCLLSHKSSLLLGVRREMQFIKDELESMNGFLSDLTMSEGHGNQVRVWMRQVREVAYDAEDCIDEFIHHLGEPSGMSILRRLIGMLRALIGQHGVSIQLQELKARAKDVGERRTRYGVVLPNPVLQGGNANRASRHLDPQLHALFTEEAQLVGIDEPRNALVSWLTKDVHDEPNRSVLAIVGFGGLGKTTLARMSCESPEVKSANFDCCALFTVSHTFNVRTLFQHMKRELILRPKNALAIAEGRHSHLLDESHGMIERLEVTDLANEINEYLQDKRYIQLFLLNCILTLVEW